MAAGGGAPSPRFTGSLQPSLFATVSSDLENLDTCQQGRDGYNVSCRALPCMTQIGSTCRASKNPWHHRMGAENATNRRGKRKAYYGQIHQPPSIHRTRCKKP